MTLTPRPRVALVATMPRSGTWYHHYFFHVYHHVLLGKREMGVRVTAEPQQGYRDTMGIDLLLIAHLTCPDFERYEGAYRQKWEALKFYVPGFQYGNEVCEPLAHHFYPSRNPHVRIVYVYRNPLDQAVSFFRHAQQHRDPSQRYRMDDEGNRVPIRSVSDYLTTVGMDAWLKHYLTFLWMRDLYPENIRLLSYEGAVKDPMGHFLNLLDFFGHRVASQEEHVKLEATLLLTRKEELKKLEKDPQSELGKDQAGAGEHIRDGSVGQWRIYLDERDRETAQARLQEFGLSLSDFVLVG